MGGELGALGPVPSRPADSVNGGRKVDILWLRP